MIKTQAILEIKRGERVYQLHLPADCPLGEVHDVVHEMKMHVVQMIADRAKAEVKEPEPEVT